MDTLTLGHRRNHAGTLLSPIQAIMIFQKLKPVVTQSHIQSNLSMDGFTNGLNRKRGDN